MSYKKVILAISFLVVSGFLFNVGAPTAQAMTAAEIQTLIQQLQQQIAQLQKQLAEIERKPTAWCHDFKVNLKYGMGGEEIRALQIALEKEGFKISESEKMPVVWFRDFTASAVVGFQEKYKGDILAPWGLEHGSSYVGKTTLAKLNQLYGCGVVTKSITVISPNGGEKWEVGKTYNITWAANGVNKTMIEVIKGNQGWHLAYNLPASQTKFSWTIPSVIGTGNNYKIHIWDQTNATPEDYSDNYFTITAATTACTDSDDGKNYLVKGTVLDEGKSYSDYCLSTSILKEYFCLPISAIGLGGVAEENYTCPSGCQDGACKTTTPSITVLSPNGGEKWTAGKTYVISWVRNISTSKIVEIKLYRGTTYLKTITNNALSGSTNGSYSWTISSDIPFADDYKMKVSFWGSPSCPPGQVCPLVVYEYSDFSDAPFSVAAPTPFTVTFPSANATLKQGSTYNLTWSGSDSGVTSYSVYLVGGNLGSAGSRFLGIAYTSQNSFSWTVPSDIAVGSGYQIQFSGVGATGDNSDSFSIVAATATPSITVLSPNGGEKWTIGEKWTVGNTYPIFWKSTGIAQTDKIRVAVVDYTNPSNLVESDLVYNLAGNLGAYSWTISSNFKTGDKYKIKVEGCKTTNGITNCYSDLSDNYFSIMWSLIY